MMNTDFGAVIRKPFVQILLLVFFGGLAYSNTFHLPFVFDDYPNIVENRSLDSLTTFFNSISWLDFSPKSRWVAWATFAANRSVGGADVTGFHVINLLIHLATGVVVYLLAKTTLVSCGEKVIVRYSQVPFIAALGFVLHPVQTQAVTYIVQRMTSLAALLYLVTLLFYAKMQASKPAAATLPGPGRMICRIVAIMSCLLALGTKEISFTLPLTLALYDMTFFKGTVRQRVVRLLPFVLCTVVMLFYLVGISTGLNAVTHGGGDVSSTPLPRLTYLFTECRVIVTYVRLLIVPVAQNLDYDYPVFSSLLQPQVAASLALILAILGFGIYAFNASLKETSRFSVPLRMAAFAVFWFFITLSIESGIVPLLDTIAEQRLYLPSVWFFIALAVFAAEFGQASAARRKFVAAVVVLLCIFSGYATYQRNNVWRNRASLWGDVVQKAPNNVRALTNLGKYYVDVLDPAAALPLLEKAVTLNPNYSPAHYSLGVALVQRGDSERALAHYVMTTRLAPGNPKGWEDAGRLLLEKGNYREAAYFLRRACELDPTVFTAQEKAWLREEL